MLVKTLSVDTRRVLECASLVKTLSKNTMRVVRVCIACENLGYRYN